MITFSASDLEGKIMFAECFKSQNYSSDVFLLLSNDIITQKHIDDLVQDCSNSSALAMELLQSCTKPSI